MIASFPKYPSSRPVSLTAFSTPTWRASFRPETVSLSLTSSVFSSPSFSFHLLHWAEAGAAHSESESPTTSSTFMFLVLLRCRWSSVARGTPAGSTTCRTAPATTSAGSTRPGAARRHSRSTSGCGRSDRNESTPRPDRARCADPGRLDLGVLRWAFSLRGEPPHEARSERTPGAGLRVDRSRHRGLVGPAARLPRTDRHRLRIRQASVSTIRTRMARARDRGRAIVRGSNGVVDDRTIDRRFADRSKAIPPARKFSRSTDR